MDGKWYSGRCQSWDPSPAVADGRIIGWLGEGSGGLRLLSGCIISSPALFPLRLSAASPWSKKRYLLRYLEGVEASHTVSLCHCVTEWQLAINVIVPFFLLGLRHRPLDDKRGTGLQVV